MSVAPLRRARRAAGELNVHRIIELHAIHPRDEFAGVQSLAVAYDVIERNRAVLGFTDQDQRPQLRDTLGGYGTNERKIVSGLEPRRGDQRAAPGCAEHVLQFGRPIGGIDVDQDQTRLCRGVLRDDPFRVVGTPYADAVPALQATGEQARGERIHTAVQFSPRPANALVPDHERFRVRPRRGCFLEVLPAMVSPSSGTSDVPCT